MKILWLAGFLSSIDDMKPFAKSCDENIFVDIKDLVSQSTNLSDLKNNFYNEYGFEDYDLSVGYSFGGRILSRLEKINSKKIFVSSNILNLSEEVLLQRSNMAKKWRIKFKDSLLSAKKEWSNLELFNGHLMSEYREKFSLAQEDWSEDEILNYLDNFFSFIEKPVFKETDIYIHGELDKKYTKIGEKLSGKLQIRKMKNAAHRCCFENDEAFRSLIQDLIEKVCKVEV